MGGVGSLTENDINGTVTYTVTFDSNGGTEIDPVKVPSGSTIEKPNDPLKEGYVFSGWFKDNETFNDPFIFGTDGDKISHDITLYAQWFEPDTLIAEYAAGEIVIGYAAGDNAKHVTQNLTLPTKIESSDITWESNSGAVSTNGTVTRQNTDTDVILTATANYNGKKSATKTFNVKVIKKRTRDNSKIEALTIANASSGDVTITRNESGDVTDIEGQYVSFNIENADDALDAVTVLRGELGIKNPAEELKTFSVSSHKYGAEYQLDQVYNGIEVLGRGIMVSANSKTKGDFIHSNILSSDIVAKVKGNIAQSTAETTAKGTRNVTVDSERTEKVIYTYGKYADEPVYAYIVRVYGTVDGEEIDESVVVNGDTGEVIGTSTNILGATGRGYTELDPNTPVEFHVEEVSTLFGENQYFMSNPDLHLQIYNGIVPIRALSTSTDWADSHQVSTYVNMIEVMKWWKTRFGRDSLDGNGGIVKVVTHAGSDDNAEWSVFLQQILVYDGNSSGYTSGSDIDVLLHESTHGVMQYNVGWLNPKNAITRSISEGYADIFACIRKEEWQFNEDQFTGNASFDCMRNIASPDNVKSIYGFALSTGEVTADDAYVRSMKYVSHAAYLMQKKGLTWEELGDVWYHSMNTGLRYEARDIFRNEDFEDAVKMMFLRQSSYAGVRDCVVTAAKKMSLSPEKITAIEEAFDEAWYGKKTPAPTPSTGEVPIDATNFPDDYFRSYVKQNFDTDSSDTLSAAEIANVISLHFHAYRDGHVITSLKGIEYLTSLQELECFNNNLISLDLRSNTALERIVCYQNQNLTELHVETCVSLKELLCNANRLTSLDVSNCSSLEILWCNDNQLRKLDISGCTSLLNLDCNANQLISLDVSNNISLGNLNCEGNQLRKLDVSSCTSLRDLICSNNQLTSLDVSNHTSLEWLDCKGNQLKELDVRGCTALYFLSCYDNQLTILDMTDCWPIYFELDENEVTIINGPIFNDNANSTVNDSSIILAALPSFNASQTCEKSFNVSFDTIAPKGSTLIFTSESKDLSGTFLNDDGEEITMPLTESLDHAKVLADFEQGKNYSPVIIAENENENSGSNSGCNAGMFGIVILFAGVIFARKH